jgi:hypothetical protein
MSASPGVFDAGLKTGYTQVLHGEVGEATGIWLAADIAQYRNTVLRQPVK